MVQKIELSESILKKLYLENELSTYQIAKEFNCDPSVIQRRLKEHNIVLRNPKKKRVISKKELENLYIDRNLSTQKISKLLNIGSATIYYRLKELGIKTREKKIIKINEETLRRLYIHDKLSLSKIAKIYGCNTVTIFNKLKLFNIKTRDYYQSNIKFPKKQFNGDKYLKAYMVGFRLGDLNVKSLNSRATVVIKSCTTKEDQRNLIKEVYGSYGHFWEKRYGQVYNLIIFLDKSFNFLVKKEDNLDSWILNNPDYFWAFLGGYSDAEGNFGVYNNQARFRIGSYDKNLLIQIKNKLASLDINAKFRLETPSGYHNQNNDFYRVSINDKESLLKFIYRIKHHIMHIKRYNDLLKCEMNILERNKRKKLGIRS